MDGVFNPFEIFKNNKGDVKLRLVCRMCAKKHFKDTVGMLTENAHNS